MKKEDENWGYFNAKNNQHAKVLSLMHEIGWTEKSTKYGKIPDTQKLSEFLKSDKSPVKLPLKEMNNSQVSKLIVALEGVAKHKKAKNV